MEKQRKSWAPPRLRKIDVKEATEGNFQSLFKISTEDPKKNHKEEVADGG